MSTLSERQVLLSPLTNHRALYLQYESVYIEAAVYAEVLRIALETARKKAKPPLTQEHDFMIGAFRSAHGSSTSSAVFPPGSRSVSPAAEWSEAVRQFAAQRSSAVT